MTIQVERVPNLRGDLPVARLAVSIVLNDSAGTVLGSDTLRLQSFSGTESIAQPFVFNLEIRANDYTFGGPTDIFNLPKSELVDEERINFPGAIDGYPEYGESLAGRPEFPTVTQLDFNEILGSMITVQLQVAEQAAIEETNKWSYFNGIVTSISLSDRGCYQVEMKPRLSLMGLQNHYRAYRDCTIVDVLESLLEENGIVGPGQADGSAGYEFSVTGLANYRRQDWLQLGETDADFFNRLLEKAGLFYYFTHDRRKHTIVLTDTNYYQAIREPHEHFYGQGQAPVKKLYLAYSTSGQEREDCITQFKYKQNLMPGVSSVLVQKQSAWQSQNTAIASPVLQDTSLVSGAQNIEELHTVAYGASEEELRLRHDILAKQLISARFGLTGASSCPQLRCGSYFLLADSAYHRAEDDDVFEGDHLPGRTELNGERMVAISVTHHAEVEGKYSNQFEAVGYDGHGKAYQPHGDNSGNILAVVCDSPNFEGVIQAPQRGRKFVEKKDFVGAATKTFLSNDTAYSAKGVYVRLVTQGADEHPIWARLRDDTSTIPERGVYVTVARSSDDTEMPEVQQILESKGNLNVMPEGFSVSCSWGNSYNTNYGDSWRVSLASGAKTHIHTAKSIVEHANLTSNYDDVSFGESASANVNVSAKSYSLSMTGTIPESESVLKTFSDVYDSNSDPDGIIWSDYEQYSRTINFGRSYSKTTNHGATHNKTYDLGEAHNYTEQKEHQHSETLIHKTSYNKTTQNGIQYNHNWLASTEDYTLKGASNTMSVEGTTLAVTIAGVTNSISMTGITNTLELSTMTNFIKVNGPGYQVDESASTPKAALTTFKSEICLGISSLL